VLDFMTANYTFVNDRLLPGTMGYLMFTDPNSAAYLADRNSITAGGCWVKEPSCDRPRFPTEFTSQGACGLLDNILGTAPPETSSEHSTRLKDTHG